MEGGFRAPALIRWPGKVPAGRVENGIMSGLNWFSTFVAAASTPNIVDEIKKGKPLGDRTYKVHLDSYNQLDLITGKGPSTRHEIFYFGESVWRRWNRHSFGRTAANAQSGRRRLVFAATLECVAGVEGAMIG